MRVLLTGATGFIGKALCRELAQAGHEVVALARDPTRARKLLPSGVKATAWPGPSEWVKYATGDYGIINLAGENLSAGRWTKAKKERILRSRLTVGKVIVDGIVRAERKPRVVIQASAVGYYGPRQEELLDESSPPREGFLSLVCRSWERSTAGLETLGIRRVVVRSGVVFGQRGGALPRFVLPFRLFLGGPLGNGEQWLSWIHIQDEVRAILFLMEREDLQGAFNLTSPCPFKEKDFSRALGAALHRPSWLPVPAIALRLMFGDMADEMLLSGQRVNPKRLMEAGYSFLYPTAETALLDLLK